MKRIFICLLCCIFFVGCSKGNDNTYKAIGNPLKYENLLVSENDAIAVAEIILSGLLEDFHSSYKLSEVTLIEEDNVWFLYYERVPENRVVSIGENIQIFISRENAEVIAIAYDQITLYGPS